MGHESSRPAKKSGINLKIVFGDSLPYCFTFRQEHVHLQKFSKIEFTTTIKFLCSMNRSIKQSRYNFICVTPEFELSN